MNLFKEGSFRLFIPFNEAFRFKWNVKGMSGSGREVKRE